MKYIIQGRVLLNGHTHLSSEGFSQWQSIQSKKGSREDKSRAGAIGGSIGGKLSKGGGRPSKSNFKKSELMQLVLDLKGKGLSNRMIADDLNISASTVSIYLQNSKQ